MRESSSCPVVAAAAARAAVAAPAARAGATAVAPASSARASWPVEARVRRHRHLRAYWAATDSTPMAGMPPGPGGCSCCGCVCIQGCGQNILGYHLQHHLGAATHFPSRQCHLKGRGVPRACALPPQTAAWAPCCRPLVRVEGELRMRRLGRYNKQGLWDSYGAQALWSKGDRVMRPPLPPFELEPQWRPLFLLRASPCERVQRELARPPPSRPFRGWPPSPIPTAI